MHAYKIHVRCGNYCLRCLEMRCKYYIFDRFFLRFRCIKYYINDITGREEMFTHIYITPAAVPNSYLFTFYSYLN